MNTIHRAVSLHASMLLAFACLSPVLHAAVPAPKIAKADTQVGAFYFPGWASEERWYCMAANPAVLHPQMGYYREGSPEVADWQIKQAVEHGVSFFAFDYYSNHGSQWLETALDEGFLKCKGIKQFKFCLNWCNEISDGDELQQLGDIIIKKYLTHPSFLKVDGKPVLMILGGSSFAQNLGVEQARQKFDALEQRCKQAGLKGLYLMFGDGAVVSTEVVKSGFASGADGYFLYNYPYAGVPGATPGKHDEVSYEHLIQQADGLMKHWQGITDGRFWPTVMAGWDRRPWTKQADLRRTGTTPELFAKSLKSLKPMVNEQRILLIEAWNEWGEGSILEPSREQGCAYLDKVREVFCPKAGAHPKSYVKLMQTSAPQFRFGLPSRKVWSFNDNLLGFVPSGMSDVKVRGGLVSGVATGNDPQLLSPPCYLECSQTPRVRFRLRATDPANQSGVSEGEFFWSTVDSDMNGDTRATFEISQDGQWHTYELDLSKHPFWKGRTDRFRLDPGSTPGATIEVDEIRFD
ncbi:MAG: glycoside hydrolase family 99-like domain-containing protein [Armatimonadota bacterium]